MRLLSLAAATFVLTGTLTGGTALAATESAADCLADAQVSVPAIELNGPASTDPLAITPEQSAYPISAYESPCVTTASVTVSRPDGSSAHEVALDYVCDQAGCGPLHVRGVDQLTYATGTGQWRVTKITSQGQTATLTHPVSFTIKRASTATVSAAVTVPSTMRASGTVKYWTSTGVQAASPGRRVEIWTYRNAQKIVVARTTTDSAGRYAVPLAVANGTYVQAAVPSIATQGWTVAPTTVQALVLHPTSITGTAGPTSEPVIHPGTKMSTYGHLSVLTNAGKPIAYSGKTVWVQTRSKADPADGWHTVKSVVTTDTGYYYTNWYAAEDADVRVAFVSPYLTVVSSYRSLGSIDVQ